MNVQRRQSPTCVLPYPGERDPEVSSWGLLPRSRAVQANLSPRCPAWDLGSSSWSSSAGLRGEQSPEATNQGFAWLGARLRGWDVLLSDTRRWHIALRTGWMSLWCWRGVTQSAAAPCRNAELRGGRWCCSSQWGEVRRGFHTAKWEKWYLVVLSVFPPS